MKEKTNHIKLSKLAGGLIAALAGLVVIGAVFATGYFIGRGNVLTDKNGAKIVNTESGKLPDVDFSLYWEAWRKLKEKSAVVPDNQKMVDGSIAGMVSSLGDPYTVFFEPEANKRFREDISGEFSGIGVEIVSKNNLPTVVAPLSGTPAEKAGLKAGDIILDVDGQDTSKISFDDTIDRIRGEKGKPVKLKIAREGVEPPLELDVVRDTIQVKSVKWDHKDYEGKRYLVIKIRQFGGDTDDLFEQAADEALKTKPDGIIIDLRNDPGGYLETAVNLASYFIDGGVVVSEKGKDSNNKDYKTTKKAKLKNFKLAVLVNKGSASASEIFTGAVQDRGAGKAIGEKTFGKGSVQELVDLSNGSSIKVTIAKWFTPNGRQINEKGLDPDIAVADDEKTTEDEQTNRALQYLTKGE